MQAQLDELRALVATAVPDANEFIYHGALGYGRTAKGYQRLLYIAPFSTHIYLGFFYGTSIDDPNCLLEGTGARTRHAKIDPDAQVNPEAITGLLRSAWQDGHNRFK